MSPALDPSQILPAEEYRPHRAETRRAMMQVRAGRRVRVGDQMLFSFENAETLRYQVQEMITVEHITDREAIAHEVEAYSRYLPGPDRLVATLFIENPDVRTVKADLARLTGVQHEFHLQVGDDHDVPAVEIPGPDEDGPSTVTHSVHFLVFTFDDTARAAFLDPSIPARITVNHPRYRDSGEIPGQVRETLIADLTA